MFSCGIKPQGHRNPSINCNDCTNRGRWLGSQLGNGQVFGTPALSKVERSEQLERLMKSVGNEYTLTEWKDHYSEKERV